ncbi:hypothetical protein Tco_1355379 [Tanacetum coccineum]
MGLPATNTDDGIHTLSLLPKETPTDPQYRGRNIQLMGMEFPFMIINLSRDGTKYQSLGDFEALMEESKDELRDFTIKDDHALDAKVLAATDAYIKNSSNLIQLNMHMKEVIKTYQQSSSNLLSLVEMLKEANAHGLMHTLKAIQNAINTQVDHHYTLAESYRSLAYNVGPRLTKIKLSQESIRYDIPSLKANTSDIKEIVTVMFYAFKGDNSTYIVSNSPFVPSHEPSLERQIMKVVNATPIQTIFPTTSYPTPSITHEAQVIELSSIPSHTYPIIDTTPPKDQPGSSSFITLKVNKGKGIARDTHDLPPKLIKASRKVYPDLDAPVLIEYMIDGKKVLITHDELKAHLDKKEKMKQAAKEAELSKLDIMKVATKLVNEAEVQI